MDELDEKLVRLARSAQKQAETLATHPAEWPSTMDYITDLQDAFIKLNKRVERLEAERTRLENAMRDVRNGGLVEEALGALDALRSETRIPKGHPDPGAVRDCFDTVEMALLAASEDTPQGGS